MDGRDTFHLSDLQVAITAAAADRTLSNPPAPVFRFPRLPVLLGLGLLLVACPVAGYLLFTQLTAGAAFYLFAGLLAAAAAALVLIYLAVTVKRISVGKWAGVEATVIEARVEWGPVRQGGRSAQTWKPVFVYEYVVGGRTYEGKRLAFFRRSTGSSAQELVQRHPVGSRVQVFYDPADPSESVLDRRVRAAWALPLFAAVCGGVALVFCLLPALLGE